ncbi:hypothetical protein [Pseudomonas anguilliseptica]|uniref:hypothetical protein n=1 Tax=Pseudomonas anguilliseptica TaxID=53406 RepID=UPI001F2F1A1C|nr:hypothetical protein [Pseudomonas anguilliseptica]MCE5365217.1 hypothetical protein [Pseudomonas anguilliseptica]
MSVQTLWWLIEAQPGLWLNGLALFVALAGSWLLLATRLREQRAVARLLAGNQLNEMTQQAYALDEPTERLNRFFYRFAAVCLVAALCLSWVSTRL